MRLAARLMAIVFTASLLLPALIAGPVSAAGPADATQSTISALPSSITVDDTSTIVVQVNDTDGLSMGVGGDNVELSASIGDLTSVTDIGDGTYSATLSSTDTGTAHITGKVNGADISDSDDVTVTAGTVDHITLGPASSSQAAGVNETYTVLAYDQFDNLIGNVTAASTFGITATGSCDDPTATCQGTSLGGHTVTATYSGKTATSTLTVTAGTVDHITLGPASSSQAAGVNETYTVLAYDQFDNLIGNVTAASTFGITATGSCDDPTATCQGTSLGGHTVTATYSGKTATSTLTVTAGTVDHITLGPASSSQAAGVNETYTVLAYDQFDNLIGNVTAASTFGITATGSCDDPTATCQGTSLGGHTVTATYSGKTATSTLTVTAGTVDHITLGPASSSQAAGVNETYTVLAYDQFDNLIGNVTAASTFGITATGSCDDPTATCQGTSLGGHTVTATYSGKTATSTLTVTAGTVDHITLGPASSSQAAGVNETYTVLAYDQFDNLIGNVTAASTFGITATGSCDDPTATCQGTSLGGHTVTATYSGKTATSTLTVTAGTVDHIVISPDTSSRIANQTQAYTAEAFDFYDNSGGFVTGSTVFTIAGGTCVSANCSAASVGDHQVTGTFGVEVDTATLTVTNSPPDAVDDPGVFVNEDAVAYPINVLNNDSDPNTGDTFTITSKLDGLHGTVVIVPTNDSVTYTPVAGYNGTDTFDYTITDNHGLTDTATVSLTVVAINDAPTFTLGSGPSFAEDSGLQTVVFASGNAGAPEEAGQILTYVITDVTNQALFAVLPTFTTEVDLTTGDLSFTPAANASGTSTVTVHVTDNGPNGGGDVNISPDQTFTITITPVDDAPVAAPDGTPNSYLVKQGMATAVAAASGVLVNDTDIDSPHSALTAVLDTQPSNGSVTLNADGSFTYTPTGLTVGPDSFSYHAFDGTSGSNVVTVSILVYINHAPTAVGDIVTVVAGSPYTALSLLTNDNAANPDPGEVLRITHVSNPPHGSATVTGGGTGVSYRPDSTFHGTDLFSYTISDGVFTSSATVLVKVPRDTYKPVATAPVQAIKGQSLGSTTAVVYLSWTGTDRGYGVAKSELWQSVNGHSYTKVKTTTGHSATVTAKFGSTYRFRVRAIDKKGNVGAYAYGPTFRASLLQETSASYSNPWTAVNSSAYSGGHDRLTTTAGNTATLTSTGRTFAWVSAKGSMRSTADVYVDGVLKAHVNLAASTSKYRYVAYSITFAASGLHSLQVVYTGPTNKRVDVDAFVLLR